MKDLFHHVIATLHDPTYREANAAALRMEWPRIPIPSWPNGEGEATAEELARSAERGRALAALLDSDVPVSGTTQMPLSPQFASIAVLDTISGRNHDGSRFRRHCWLGPLRPRRYGNAGPGTRHRARILA